MLSLQIQNTSTKDPLAKRFKGNRFIQMFGDNRGNYSWRSIAGRIMKLYLREIF